MATQAGDIYQEQVRACEARKVPPLATLENPPGSEESGGAWDLPELQKALEETKGVKIPYHSCAFMVKGKTTVFEARGLGRQTFRNSKAPEGLQVSSMDQACSSGWKTDDFVGGRVPAGLG